MTGSIKRNALKHGHSAGGRCSSEYITWCSIIQRCENPGATVYAEYGGRGISVCSRWRSSFENFLNDMGLKPTIKHTIERDDPNGNYCPDNCRWATRQEQARNRRNSRRLTVGDETLLLIEWAARLGCNHTAILNRIRRGWTEEAAVTTPIAARYRRK